jgi:hypothetical protein
MQLTLLHGYPDFVGLRCTWCGYGNGPSSLLSTGDPISLPRYNYYIDDIGGDFISVSGNYGVVGKPSAVGPRASWVLVWRFATSGSVASVTIGSSGAGTGMTPGTYLISATGGGGTGAQVSVVVASSTLVSSATVISPGSGYTSAPTIPTTALGGAPPSLTAVLSVIAAPVAAGANLSAEQVQIMGFGGQY